MSFYIMISLRVLASHLEYLQHYSSNFLLCGDVVSLARCNIIFFCMDGCCAICVAVGLANGVIADLLYPNKVMKLWL
jgi:hypothetical protein